MIDKKELMDFIGQKLQGTDIFLTDLTISPENDIKVELDSDSSLDIDKCVELTREIENAFDRDAEDYDLEVGSAGITAPFKVKRQYDKNIGREVEVLAKDGIKHTGLLLKADDNGFTIETERKVKVEGQKKPAIEKVELTFAYGDVKHTKYLLKF